MTRRVMPVTTTGGDDDISEQGRDDGEVAGHGHGAELDGSRAMTLLASPTRVDDAPRPPLERRVDDRGPRGVRVPGLDSMRALAVLLVVGYHLHVPGMQGGFVGVTVFFVISGYLITRLMLTELAATGSIDFVEFYRRRARRLLPAAYLVVVASLAWATLMQRDLLVRLPGDAAAALGYVSNWSMVVRDVSYFESFGLPSPLTHFWSLAVEEQFYLLWPPLLLALVLLVRQRRRALAIVTGFAAASALALAVLHAVDDDPSRAYMGTDTRAGELLVGALLAIALHWDAVRAARPLAAPSPLGRLRLAPTASDARALAVAGGVVLLLLVRMVDDASSFVYVGGLLVAALASAALLLAVGSHRLGVAGRLDRGPVGWLGRRSYAVYLWHYPVLIACSTPADLGDFSAVKSVVVLALTVALAAASYRWVERPVRVLGMRGYARALVRHARALPVPARSAVLGGGAAVLLAAVAGGVGVVGPTERDHGPSSVAVGVAAGQALPAGPPAPGRTSPTDGIALPGTTTQGLGLPGTVPGVPALRGTSVAPAVPNPAPNPAPAPQAPVASVPSALSGPATLAVGDSLMIDIARRLEKLAPGISIDARVGRQPWQGLKVARRFDQFNRPGGTYLLGIGTNGAIDVDDLDRFVVTHASARVLLITPRVDRSWETTSVRAIREVGRRHANVGVVDFHRIARGHPEWFAPDGVHLTTSGVRAMVAEIAAVAARTPVPAS